MENITSWKDIDWASSIFLFATPVIALIFTPLYYVYNPFSWDLTILFICFYYMTTLSITSGYHRLISHRAYEASPFFRFFILFFGGAAAFQGSALEWCSDHRRHHLKVDTKDDPYNIKQGFFHAHLGWMLKKNNANRKIFYGKDLLADPMIAFQDKYYFLIAGFSCFGIPLLIGFAIGKPWGGLLIGGVTRLVLAHHATFFINSLCHTLGRQPYQDENSAKDSLIMSVLTQGEGLHNFHHKFASDYRNGVRWYDWDPTKWLIQVLKFLGLARNLKKTPGPSIFRAKLEMDYKRLLKEGYSQQKIDELKERLEAAQMRLRTLQENYKRYKAEWKKNHLDSLDNFKLEYKKAKLEFQFMLKQWARIKRVSPA